MACRAAPAPPSPPSFCSGAGSFCSCSLLIVWSSSLRRFGTSVRGTCRPPQACQHPAGCQHGQVWTSCQHCSQISSHAHNTEHASRRHRPRKPPGGAGRGVWGPSASPLPQTPGCRPGGVSYPAPSGLGSPRYAAAHRASGWRPQCGSAARGGAAARARAQRQRSRSLALRPQHAQHAQSLAAAGSGGSTLPLLIARQVQPVRRSSAAMAACSCSAASRLLPPPCPPPSHPHPPLPLSIGSSSGAPMGRCT
jgi:hypothetical protein